MSGKVSQATKLINREDSVSGVHSITEKIIEILREKHPKTAPTPSQPISSSSTETDVQPVLFENIDEEAIKAAAKTTFGSGGPSQIDADVWKKLICSNAYGKCTDELSQAIACMARRLCTEDIDPECMEELLSCRLIPLNKNPGVRPIGVGEVLRRIFGKAVIKLLK